MAENQSSISKKLGLEIPERQLMIACGAGAGLAAVYQVTFASTLFVLETLGVAWKLKNIGIILVTTYLSAYCARPIVGGKAIYLVDKVSLHTTSMIQIHELKMNVTPLALIFKDLENKES